MYRDRRGYAYTADHRYVGKNELLAEVEALGESSRRLTREEEQAPLRAAPENLDDLDGRVGRNDERLDLLVRAVLVVYGCHKHRRQWRRGRNMAKPESKPLVPVKVPGPASTKAELLEFIRRAESGDREKLPRVRFWLESLETVEVFEAEPIKELRRTLARKMFGKDLIQQEIRLKRCEELAEQLAGSGASILERLLCDQIATSQLHLTVVEWEAAAQTRADIALLCERAADCAHKRYLTTVKTLAQAGWLRHYRPWSGKRTSHEEKSLAEVRGEGRGSSPGHAGCQAPACGGRASRAGGSASPGRPAYA